MSGGNPSSMHDTEYRHNLPVDRRFSFASLNAVLGLLQLVCLAVLLIVSPTTYRNVLWDPIPHPYVFVEFRAIVLFLTDFVLAALLFITLLRLGLDVSYRARLAHTFALAGRLGGRWWITLVGWMTLSVWWANAPVLARYHTLQAAACLAMAYLVADFARSQHVLPLLGAMVAGAVGQALVAISQTVHGGAIGVGWLGEIAQTSALFYRANGLSVNPNNLAGYLLVGLFAWAGLLIITTQLRSRRVLYGLGTVITGGLFATMSRSALLALALTLSWLVVRFWRDRGSLTRPVFRLLLVLASAAIIFAGVILVFNPLSLIPVTARPFYLADTRHVIADNPLLGCGAGNLLTAIVDLSAEVIDERYPAHNVYLVIQAELGVVGLIIFLAGCARILIDRSRKAAIWQACWLVLCIVMLFDYYPWYDHRSRVMLFGVIGMWWGHQLQAETAVPLEEQVP